MVIKNSTKNSIICTDCQMANHFFTRFKGLMGKPGLSSGSGLWIVPCNSIHMFFMKIPLDIIFLDKGNNVVHLIENIKPWRVSKIVPKAHSVLELPIGTISQSSTSIGDKVEAIHYE